MNVCERERLSHDDKSVVLATSRRFRRLSFGLFHHVP